MQTADYLPVIKRTHAPGHFSKPTPWRPSTLRQTTLVGDNNRIQKNPRFFLALALLLLAPARPPPPANSSSALATSGAPGASE